MRNISRLAAFSLACAAVSVATAAPYTGYYYPSSLQVGTKTRVVVGGQALGSVKGGCVTGGGVKITRVVVVPGFPRATGKSQPRWVTDWIYEMVGGVKKHHDLPPEAVVEDTDWAYCTWWEAVDERDSLELQILARDRYTPEMALQATPALDQLMILDIEVDKDAAPGRRDIMVYDAHGMSMPHAFYITKEPHAAEQFFVIPPHSYYGTQPLVVVLHMPNDLPAQDLPVVLDGQVWPGETDVFRLKLKKGRRVTCALTAREMLPYLGDAVPGFFNPALRLLDAQGKVVSFADDFYYLPDPVLSLVVPEDGVYTLEVYDNLFRGRSDFVYTVSCYEDKPDGPFYTPQQRAFECFPPPASHSPAIYGTNGVVFKGAIDCPGRTVRHNLKIDEPKTLAFDLFARRCGSPLDGVVKLYGPVRPGTPVTVAPLLAEWDDLDKFLAGSVPQAICDAYGTWAFREPGEYAVTVTDRAGSGGDAFTYTLVVAPPEPTFEVYSEKSSFVIGGGSATFRVRVVRKNGFKGAITFDDGTDFTFNGGYIPDDVERGEISVAAVKDDWSGLREVNFTASAEMPDGRRKRVRVTPADPVEQAFAYTHLLPAHAFYFYRPGSGESLAPTPEATGKKKFNRENHANGLPCSECHTNR